MLNVFRRVFLDGFTSADVNLITVIFAMIVTLLLGVYIFYAYRILANKSFYSHDFAISLVGMSIVTAGVIVTVQSNVIVSLGMVGALSIVRFRTAIKNPMDLMFLFWAISAGIICGAGFAAYAYLLSVVLTLALIFLNNIPSVQNSVLLVINSTDSSVEASIDKIVKQYTKRYFVKSRNLTKETYDLTIELRTEKCSDLIQAIMSLPGVLYAGIITNDSNRSI